MENYNMSQSYTDWRGQMNVVQAFKENRLLPTDKKILVSLPIMVLALVAYSVIFFYS
jgi:hypothetical protein